MSVKFLWPTPLYRSTIPDPMLIHALSTEITCDPDASSNDACTISRDKVQQKLANLDPLFCAVMAHLHRATAEYFEQAFGLSDVHCRIEPFYLLHKQGGSVRYHNHPASTATGVLYVNVPAGHVTLLDPRPNANRGMPQEIIKTGHFDPIEILPVAGEILIFPAYVYHLGTPNASHVPRMVLPFDINVCTDD